MCGWSWHPDIRYGTELPQATAVKRRSFLHAHVQGHSLVYPLAKAGMPAHMHEKQKTRQAMLSLNMRTGAALSKRMHYTSCDLHAVLHCISLPCDLGSMQRSKLFQRACRLSLFALSSLSALFQPADQKCSRALLEKFQARMRSVLPFQTMTGTTAWPPT